MRLLYVDDDRINILLFEEVCRIAGGLEISSAGSGADALAAARETRPDLLVIDLHLPDTTGMALLPLLRTQCDLPSVPAFLCTADEPEQVRAAALAAGFQGCWTKPVDVRLLLAELARILHPPA